jgi:hypothetical protein
MTMPAKETTTAGRLLRRKCGCGQHTTASGACAKCSNAAVLQRRATGEAQGSEAPPIVHDVLRSPGQPIDGQTRNFMEHGFGRDFSDVRVHTDSRAAASARAVGALAYTVGRDVVFGDGHYAPETREGKSLLAHELTHVAQNSATVTNQSAPISIGPEGDRFEAEADRRANAVARGELTASSASAVTPASEPGRLSRAKFKVGNAEVNIDYGDVYKSLTGSFESVIETRFTTWTGSPASTIHNELTALSNLAKEWVIFALDLLVDNPVTGLDKVQAVQRLIKYAPGAQYQHGSDKAPTYNFANEALSVSGWFEKALTSGLGALSSVRQSFVEQRINPASASSSSSSASSACPNPRSDKLNKAKLESDLPGQLETYLKTVVVPTNVKTQAMSPLLKIADAIQERARTYYAPYADHSRGEGNTLVQQWQYSSHLVSSQSPAATPNPEMRHDYIESRAKKVGGGGLFSQVNYDQRCADDANVLESIVQKMQQQSNILALVDPILRQKSLTTPDSPRQVVLNLDVDKKTSDCDARWKAIRTLCHELMHVMEHDDFRAAIKGRQILREGFPEVLGHYLYEHIRGDASMKARMEDGVSSAPCSSPPASTIGYDPDGPKAEEVRIAVQNDRFRAAFFLGQLSLAGIQPKRIDEADSNNPQEREADEAAQAVSESRPLQSPISRASFTAAGHHFATGSGAQLEPTLRHEMEGRLGHDFSDVRVHTDSEAAESASAMRAQAYTAGRDIFFNAGRYSPETANGRRLIAHELTHVAQGGHGLARKPEPDSDLGTIPAGPLNLGGAALERARRFEPRFREHRPTAPPVSVSWKRRVIEASSRPRGPDRTAGFLALINEAMAPDVQRFPELRFPVALFRSNQAARHGEVSLDGNSDSEPGQRGLRADTRTHQHAGEPQRRGFIVLTPGALHQDAGADFTRRTVHHEYVHFLQNLRGELTVRPACVATFRGSPVGGNPNREVVAVSTTFARFFPAWADASSQAEQQRPPHHIVEDLMLLKASFRCAEESIKTAALDRILATVSGHPERRRILLNLVRDVSSRDTPNTTLARSDDAMARLSDALGEPLPRDPRLPAQPQRPTFGPLFDLPRAIERSGDRMRERMGETVP